MLGGAVSGISSLGRQGNSRAAARSTMAHAGRDVDFADRAVAALPYLVPLFDGLKYGKPCAAIFWYLEQVM